MTHYTPQETAQVLESRRVLEALCARHDRLEAAAPALLQALQRLLPAAMTSRDALALQLPASASKDLVLEFLDDDINAAKAAITEATGFPPRLYR